MNYWLIINARIALSKSSSNLLKKNQNSYNLSRILPLGVNCLTWTLHLKLFQSFFLAKKVTLILKPTFELVRRIILSVVPSPRLSPVEWYHLTSNRWDDWQSFAILFRLFYYADLLATFSAIDDDQTRLARECECAWGNGVERLRRVLKFVVIIYVAFIFFVVFFEKENWQKSEEWNSEETNYTVKTPTLQFFDEMALN